MYDVDVETSLVCVSLRDFVELLIKKDLQNNIENEIIQNNIEETNINHINKLQLSTIPQEPVGGGNKIETVGNSLKQKCNENIKISNKILPFIKRQVEYYFIDKNYYKDSSLL
jgi:hypothetical protein